MFFQKNIYIGSSGGELAMVLGYSVRRGWLTMHNCQPENKRRVLSNTDLEPLIGTLIVRWSFSKRVAMSLEHGFLVMQVNPAHMACPYLRNNLALGALSITSSLLSRPLCYFPPPPCAF